MRLEVRVVNYDKHDRYMCGRKRCEGKDFVGVLKSLTLKKVGRPWGILGKEVKAHSGSLG